MKTIHKYPFMLDDTVDIELPSGAEILDIATQRGVDIGSIYLWALVDPDAPMEIRRFIVRGTGHVVPDGAPKHVATIQTDGGAFVWHVFTDGPA